eukprot:TRINITY_DN10580_c0_g1_i1.p1 TRINITY_DN10580_c0_g1~~TRINITY_DN10580_c0_g1_i1.p1  ORF type:complete len:209 (+),score=50.05 TRINITY_DN10580_c0_g1_i1:586-1212(+)
MASILGYFFGKTASPAPAEESIKPVSINEDWVVLEDKELERDAEISESEFENVSASVASVVEFIPTLGSTDMDPSMRQRFQLFLQEQNCLRQRDRATTESNQEFFQKLITLTNSTLTVPSPVPSTPTPEPAQVNQVAPAPRPAYIAVAVKPLPKKSVAKVNGKRAKISHYSKPTDIGNKRQVLWNKNLHAAREPKRSSHRPRAAVSRK